MSEVAAPLHHWTVTCTTCNGSAEHHCNTCRDILCPRCKEIHEKSNATRHHEIVQYADRLEPSKLRGECQNHPGHNHSFWCEKCAKAVCSECVTTDAHKGHALSKIATKVEEKRKVMQEDCCTYSNLLKQWDKSLQVLERKKRDFENEYDVLDRKISEQADAICNQVRRIEGVRRKTQLQNMKPSLVDVFLYQEKILQEGIENIQRQANEIENKLRSNDTDVFLEYTSELNKPTTPPKIPSPSLPVFKLGRINEDSLENMSGNFSLEKERGIDKNTSSEEMQTANPGSFNGGRDVTPKQTSDAALSLPGSKKKMSILSTARIEYTKQNFNDFTSPDLACTESGQAWMCTADSRFQLMNRQGEVSKTINIDFRMARMTITTQGDLLVTDKSNKCIKSITKEGITNTLFTTEWKPWGICCLLNGGIMVTFYSDKRVVQYSITGVVVRELDSSLFRNPHAVAQNKNNQHIYVCDSSSVLAFDMNGELRYKYTGSDENGVDPEGVCTDHAGNVLITDWRNHRVHILDQDGRFLQYIMNRAQGLHYPYCIDVDSDGYIWIREYMFSGLQKTYNKLKIYKYQK